MKAIAFVMYHPLLKSISAIFDMNLSVFWMDKEVKEVFTPWPMVSFLSACKLSSNFIRAKLYHLERTVGSYKCKGKDAKFAITSRKQIHLLVVMIKQTLR